MAPSPELNGEGPTLLVGDPSWVLEAVPHLSLDTPPISISFPRATRASHNTHGKGCTWGAPFPSEEHRLEGSKFLLGQTSQLCEVCHSDAVILSAPMASKLPPMTFKFSQSGWALGGVRP